ncbi:MAG: hypothetical protein JWN70_4266 [Planctomycetaceae bacterium]|nr:hypothetical protein [Planctomycetaceae bacterium]
MSIKRFNPTLCRGRVWGVIIVTRAAQRGLTWSLGSSITLMDNTTAELVARYRALPFASDHLGVCPTNHAKVELLCQLDEYFNESIVSQLLLDILTSADEYDLARIEAAKIVGIYVTDASPLDRQLKRQVWNVFADSNEDRLVRQHASQHISGGFGGEAEHDIIERLLFDDEDDIDVRHGALEYIRRTDDTEFVNRLIGKLKVHPYWGKFTSFFKDLQR